MFLSLRSLERYDKLCYFCIVRLLVNFTLLFIFFLTSNLFYNIHSMCIEYPEYTKYYYKSVRKKPKGKMDRGYE